MRSRRVSCWLTYDYTEFSFPPEFLVKNRSSWDQGFNSLTECWTSCLIPWIWSSASQKNKTIAWTTKKVEATSQSSFQRWLHHHLPWLIFIVKLIGFKIYLVHILQSVPKRMFPEKFEWKIFTLYVDGVTLRVETPV